MATLRQINRDFKSTERFTVLRPLGAGGMDEAHDNVQNKRVALKTMQHMDPTALYRFENEFRALADVSPQLGNPLRLHRRLAAVEAIARRLVREGYGCSDGFAAQLGDAARIAEAREVFEGEQVRCPERFIAMLAPGVLP